VVLFIGLFRAHRRELYDVDSHETGDLATVRVHVRRTGRERIAVLFARTRGARCDGQRIRRRPVEVVRSRVLFRALEGIRTVRRDVPREIRVFLWDGRRGPFLPLSLVLSLALALVVAGFLLLGTGEKQDLLPRYLEAPSRVVGFAVFLHEFVDLGGKTMLLQVVPGVELGMETAQRRQDLLWKALLEDGFGNGVTDDEALFVAKHDAKNTAKLELLLGGKRTVVAWAALRTLLWDVCHS